MSSQEKWVTITKRSKIFMGASIAIPGSIAQWYCNVILRSAACRIKTQ